jgi:uncharacterized lipoprotein YddW (UPF0748 family)
MDLKFGIILFFLFMFLPFQALSDDNEGRALWIVRTTLASRSSIDKAIESAVTGGFRTLFVQAVGRGDAFYPSKILPLSELLSVETDFDPLKYFVDQAHARDLEVHVWINLLYVWSSKKMPVSADHVINRHPEWLVVRQGNLPHERSKPDDFAQNRVSDLFLSPALPGVRSYLTAVVDEILTKYPVDGIHLDYVRYPSRDSGFGSYPRELFSSIYNVDPVDIFTDQKLAAPTDNNPPTRHLEAEWFRWRSRQITDLVAQIRKIQKMKSPDGILSVAVIPDPAKAYEVYGQDWPGWINREIVDIVVMMSYSTSKKTVLDQARKASKLVRNGRLYIGIATYNQSLEKALQLVRELRSLGIEGFSFFSYNSLLEHPESFLSIKKTLFTSSVASPISE